MVFGEIGPVEVSGRVLVPLRGVLEQAGATVEWSEQARAIRARRGSRLVELAVGESRALVNGEAVRLDVPPMIMRGTTMVPLRFVAEALGASVRESAGRVEIATQAAPAPSKPVATAPVVKPKPAQPVAVTPVQPATPTAPVGIPQTVSGMIESIDVASAPQMLAIQSEGKRTEYRLSPSVVVLSRKGNESDPARESSLAEACPGDRAMAKLDDTGKITILIVQYEQVAGLVAEAAEDALTLDTGGRITLDTLTRFRRADGSEASRDEVAKGASVRVRLRPGTRDASLITLLNAAPAATTAPATVTTTPPATGEGLQPLPAVETSPTEPTTTRGEETPGEPTPSGPATEATPPPAETAPTAELAPATEPLKVTSFSHDATAPLRAGGVLTVTLEGETGAQAVFAVGDIATDLAMQEVAPGKYVGTFTAPEGLNSSVAIFGSLTRDDRKSPLVQAGAPLVIDSVAPTISDLAPGIGTTVKDPQPVIYAVFEDEGGSGVDADQVRLVVGGEDVTAHATRSPRFVTYRPIHPIANGRVDIRIQIKDKAGNTAQAEWQFLVDAPEVPITSVAHSADKPVVLGQSFTVTLAGKARGQASFDIGTLKVGLPMTETTPGIYQGRFTAEKGDVALGVRIVAHLITESGEKFSRECSEPVTIVTVAPRSPRITSPSEGDLIDQPLIVTGHAQPGVTVRVQVVRTVRKLGIWSDTDVIAAHEVKVDSDGTFATSKMPLPGRGKAETVTVQAVAIDPAGQRSEIVSVKVQLQ